MRNKYIWSNKEDYEEEKCQENIAKFFTTLHGVWMKSIGIKGNVDGKPIGVFSPPILDR